MSSTVDNSFKENSVASRKVAAAEMRKARKAIRDQRSRLLSDSSDEVPKGILKNARIPTKRSVSECVDDLSQIMADLDLNIHDLPKATGKFCPHHNDYFNEEEEDSVDDDNQEGDNEDEENEYEEDEEEEEGSANSDLNENNNPQKKCDCNLNGDNNNKPKKSVRFNEHVYETVYIASRLYDRRSFAKYHFSSRHHPPNNQQNKSKKNRQRSSKSESHNEGIVNLKSDTTYGCKLSKSQRAKQSKKDKKKRQNKREEHTDTSSDDQGYCSSMHSFSE